MKLKKLVSLGLATLMAAGILAGALHYCLVTSVPLLHGGFCLYNGGFTAAFVALVLVPQLEQFCKTREERRAVRSR